MVDHGSTSNAQSAVPLARLADRLAAARRKQFVGRQAEVALFAAALQADEPPFAVLHIVGPGGVGKSSLLREFARLATEAGRPVVALDGRDLEPTAAGLLRVLGDATARPDAGVWLIDTYEALSSLDLWLRESFLPGLPARSLVVIAGRNRPDPAWRTDLGWESLTRIVELGNLTQVDGARYLTERGVPTPLHVEALTVSRAHPLALALVADLLVRGESLTHVDLGNAPDVVRVLVERLVNETPSLAHRQALEVSALVWATTETMLAATVSTEQAHALFGWLRDQSCIEQGPHGLFPHELARDVLEADLRWRDPGRYQATVAALFRYLYGRLPSASAEEQPRIWFSLFSLLRHHPFFAPYFAWSEFGTAVAEPARPEHTPAILAMVRQHEGEASAAIAAYWLARQPAAFSVFRDLAGEGAIFGFMAHLAIQNATAEDRATDPAIEAALSFAARSGPVQPDEEILHLRFWMHADAYQGVSPAINLAAITGSIDWTTRPKLAWNFITIDDPAFHEPHFTGIHIWRTPEADFTVGDRTFGVFAHDWRVEPAATWMDLKYDSASVSAPVSPPPAVALSRPDFDTAARQALRDFTRPDLLATNPLLETRLLSDPNREPPAPRLQALLREAVASLTANPKDRKLHRVLWHTYLEPAATQEQAAELLDLPFNTYRYQLGRGIERVAAWLWERAHEIGRLT